MRNTIKEDMIKKLEKDLKQRYFLQELKCNKKKTKTKIWNSKKRK